MGRNSARSGTGEPEARHPYACWSLPTKTYARYVRMITPNNTASFNARKLWSSAADGTLDDSCPHLPSTRLAAHRPCWDLRPSGDRPSRCSTHQHAPWERRGPCSTCLHDTLANPDFDCDIVGLGRHHGSLTVAGAAGTVTVVPRCPWTDPPSPSRLFSWPCSWPC